MRELWWLQERGLEMVMTTNPLLKRTLKDIVQLIRDYDAINHRTFARDAEIRRGIAVMALTTLNVVKDREAHESVLDEVEYNMEKNDERVRKQSN